MIICRKYMSWNQDILVSINTGIEVVSQALSQLWFILDDDLTCVKWKTFFTLMENKANYIKKHHSRENDTMLSFSEIIIFNIA